MAYLEKIIAPISNSAELNVVFQKKKVMNPKTIRAPTHRRIVNREPKHNSRSVGCQHISSLITFISNIKYHFYIERNYVHHDAFLETYKDSKCLGLGQNEKKERNKPKTRIWTFTIVCKGTSKCRAPSYIVGQTSKRRFCG